MATCYRHPSRETGVSCSNCGKPICPDCMTATPVGMRCPDCSRQKTQTRSLQSIAVDPIATYVLIAINVAVYFGVHSSSQFSYHDLTLFGSGVYQDGTLHGVAEGEWWRLVTSGFLHTETVHLLLNMLSLFWLGRMIEPALGHARYVAIYLVSLLAGSLGVMLLDPNAETLGASGAIYGLLGAAIVMARNRQISLIQSGLLPILAINFIFTLSVPGISLGGHLGGLVGGLVSTFVVEQISMRRRDSLVPSVAACAVLGVAAAVASVVAVS
ncbi:rhomboid family intramembrane serine protease [Solirubrobacter ginsenosidimutans]|uniref:Rhomboid family intramembrane serine protease n=1 Tax=Solirubrobacter ginsenosidimutans TaxID=490573 RepID=A0A9X3MYW7_9ACTN|nr:rhomboid family intramembrane serine protease [Solirubrobacter ginsenosidimutans]MDA0163835.1 rhomboid family intramembrane serine protease [Solirubrobacter ginsenosidimutans]